MKLSYMRPNFTPYIIWPSKQSKFWKYYMKLCCISYLYIWNFVAFGEPVMRWDLRSLYDTVSKASICNCVARHSFIYISIFLKSATQFLPVEHTIENCITIGSFELYRMWGVNVMYQFLIFLPQRFIDFISLMPRDQT